MMYNRFNERNDIFIAVLVLTLAFTMFLTGGIYHINVAFLPIFALTGFSVTVTAFLLHELAHRTVARRLGAVAFFKLWNLGIILALITSLFGFIIAAPGAVEFAGLYDSESEGKIAAAGPGTNIALGALFYLIYLFISTGIAGFILYYVALLNFWFALFNLIPVPPLDGSKVFYWNSKVFAFLFILSLVLNVVDGFIPSLFGL